MFADKFFFHCFFPLCQAQPSPAVTPINTAKCHHERENKPPAFVRTCCICLDSGSDAEMAFLCAAGGGEAGTFPRAAGAGAGGSRRAAGAKPRQGLVSAVWGKRGALACDCWLIFLFPCQSSSSGSPILRLEWLRLYPNPGT